MPPQAPSPMRDVSSITRSEFTRPHIPPFRTSADGRVGLHAKLIDDSLRFHLLVPERLPVPFLETDPGISIVGTRRAVALHESLFRRGALELSDHVTICDPTGAFYRPGESPSPYGCGEDLHDDCYDLTVISSSTAGSSSTLKQIWGTPIVVRVANPKTRDAIIADIDIGEPVAGATVPGWYLLEITTTNDGHLIVGRIDTPDFAWQNPSGLERRTHFVDIVYSFYPGSSGPCDVTQWRHWYPISHAPYDLRINRLYGFAAYPFRDAEGHLIPDGADLKASYPWIDRAGANLFFTAVGETLVRDDGNPFPVLTESSTTWYPARCAHAECAAAPEATLPTRGHSVAGLWTRGKIVLLDGILNNIDWALPVADESQRLVSLYRSDGAGGQAGEVLVGSGRDVGAVGHPLGSVGNVAIFDSLENLFRTHQNLVPLTSRDVVWIASNGKATDEVAFDDFINPDAFIISEMVAAMSFDEDDPRRSLLSYGNGSGGDEVRIQNAATALSQRWVVPGAGIGFGSVRLEPVALGGVRGRGLWVDGSSGLEYEVTAQPRDVTASPWYLGVFLNLHVDDDGVGRILYRFPGGQEVRIVGRSEVRYYDPEGEELRTIPLPMWIGRGSWSHLGLQFAAAGSRLLLYYDGFALDDWSAPEVWDAMVPGQLFLGGASDTDAEGLVGWLDELKVIAQDVGLEVACNHSRGTLVELPRLGDHPLAAWWRLTSDGYPSWAHDAVGGVAGSESDGSYLCFQGRVAGDRANQGPVPPSLRQLRDAFTFPEGPLEYDAPRPDSTTNAFCLSCHTPDGKGGLSLAALEQRADLPAQDDVRRQPSQPFRRVFGNVPANWLGPGRPPRSLLVPSQGITVDALLASVDVPIATPVPTREPVVVCAGDCDGDRRTSIGEIVVGVNVVLGRVSSDLCAAGYPCDDPLGCVGIADLIRAVNSSLFGC